MTCGSKSNNFCVLFIMFLRASFLFKFKKENIFPNYSVKVLRKYKSLLALLEWMVSQMDKMDKGKEKLDS